MDDRTEVISFKVTPAEKRRLELAAMMGWGTWSIEEFVRAMMENITAGLVDTE